VLRSNDFDGIKTGMCDLYKHGIVASLLHPQTKRRIILVANGYETEQERASEVERLCRFFASQTKTYHYFHEGETAYKIPVLFGNKQSVDLVSKLPVCVTVNAKVEEAPKCVMNISKKYLKGGVAKNTPVGVVTIKTSAGDKVYTLYTKEDVGQGSWLRYGIDSVKVLFY